jgi:secondary thiamine-phosphate synthase enzyme
METFSIASSSHEEMIDITSQVQQAVEQAGVSDALCLVYCPHTTGGISINENADPMVLNDLLNIFDRVVPWTRNYQHAEGNSAAHAKSSLVGCSAQVIIRQKKLVLGTWQSIFFCEFDGPRTRNYHVQITPS